MTSLGQAIYYLHFTTLVLAAFSIIDFVLRFKRPLNFKICFSILIISLFFLNLAFWKPVSFEDITRYSPLINFGIWGMGLYSLSILNNGKIERWVWIASFIIFGLNIYNFYLLNDNIDHYKDKQAVFSLGLSGDITMISLTRIAQRIIMLVSLVMLVQTIRKNDTHNNIYQQKLKRWLTVVISFVGFSILFNNLFSWIFLNEKNKQNYLLIAYNMFCLSLSILTIYRPMFLNNQVLGNLNLKRFTTVEPLKLTDQNFYTPFFSNFYYLQKDATIEKFCSQNKIEERDAFNEQIITLYNMSFSNLINKKRVEYFIDLSKNPKYQNYSIEALALESGFSSRTALYKPFKKYHGGTPIEYLNSINS